MGRGGGGRGDEGFVRVVRSLGSRGCRACCARIREMRWSATFVVRRGIRPRTSECPYRPLHLLSLVPTFQVPSHFQRKGALQSHGCGRPPNRGVFWLKVEALGIYGFLRVIFFGFSVQVVGYIPRLFQQRSRMSLFP